jgi:sugar O-acyltransferase (sialic acid O-acetyltransferase NeuD family)
MPVHCDELVIYGAGGFARELAWLATECGHKVLAYIDDSPSTHGQRLNGVEVTGLEDAAVRFPNAAVAIGIGSPLQREAVATKATAAGLRHALLIDPRVVRSTWTELGEGTVICAGSILTTNIRIGRHVQVNLHCTIGHDVVMDDFATLAPGVHISGWVHVAKGAYLGTGAVVINGTAGKPIVIGDGAVVGAGACVVKSVEPGMTVVGVPAKPIPGRQ